MAKFAYNNAKNAKIDHLLFKLNCGYQPCVFYKKRTDLCLQPKTTNKLLAKLQKLITVCQKNLYHMQTLQKQAYDKGVKPKSYTSKIKIWLNNK